MPCFFTTAVEKRVIAQKIKDNPSLLTALKKLKPDLSELDEYAKKKLEQKTDDFLTVQILGEQGSGKSGVGQKLATRWAKIPFTVDYINLQYAGFFASIETLENGQFSILDEQTVTFGTGAMRLKGDLVNIIETLRQNGGSIIIISPTAKIINTSDVHLEIEVLGRDKQYVLCAWKARSDKYLGSFVLELDWYNDLWLDYMKKKREYVKQAKSLNFAKNDYEELANKIISHPDYSPDLKKIQKSLIAEKVIPNMTIEEKKLVLAQVAILER